MAKRMYVLVQQGNDEFSEGQTLLFADLSEARAWPFFMTDFPLDAEWQPPDLFSPHWHLTHPDADTSYSIFERSQEDG